MRLLLDTLAALLWGLDASALPPVARAAIADPGNDVYLSAVSVWELAIKSGLGKLALPQPALAMCCALVAQSGFKPLEIGYEHAAAVETMPSHHLDPFDRLLIAQAQVESLRIVSGDVALDPYGVGRLWEQPPIDRP